MVSGVIAIAQAMTWRTSRRRMFFLLSGATNARCNTETRYEFLRILDCDLIRGATFKGKKALRTARLACPLWVISGHSAMSEQCPFYPQKRTSLSVMGMSAYANNRHRPD